jgi:hypothetical protein
MAFLLFPQCFQKASLSGFFNPLPHMPISGFSISAADKYLYDFKSMDKWGYNYLIK